MKRYLSYLFLVFITVAASAQDWIVKSSGTAQNLEAVEFTSQQNGWVVGDLGTTLKTTDGGETWMPVNLTNEDLQDVSFFDDMLGLIVGDNGRIFRTTNGGANWTQVTSGTDANLAGVAFGSDGYVYAAGRDGVILRSMDNGASWSLLATGDDRYRAVYASGNTHAWAVGDEGLITATADGGATWTTQSTGSASDLKDVFFHDSMTGWVVGQNDVAHKTTNGGASWMLMNSGITVGLESVSFLDMSFGVVSGNSGRTFSTTNGGTNWTLHQSPVTNELNDVFLGSQTLAWAVGNGGVILKRGTAATPEKVMLADHPSLGKILTDGAGNTLYFFTKDAFGASVCEGQCKVNWPIFYNANLEIGAGLNPVDFATITRADGDKQTTYKGWPLYYFINDNAPGDVNGEDVGGVWYVAKPDYSIMLVDNQLVGADGVNYNRNYEPGDEIVQYFVDAYGRTLYIFINDTFEQNNFTNPDFSNDPIWPIYETDNITVPSVLNPNAFSVIDVHGKKQLCYNGWPLYYFGQDGQMRGINKGVSVPSPGVWPVATADLSSPTTDVADAADVLPTAYELTQNYPNPFNPTTTISFALPQDADMSLTIYNVLGQPVRSFEHDNLKAGIHQIVWDAMDENGAQVSSGLYFYTMNSGDFSATKRMMLLK